MSEGATREVRRVCDSDEEDDWVASPTGPPPGLTVAGMAEDGRKKLQLQLIAAMFKYAEEKYGRKQTTKETEKSTAKEDFELYLRSQRARVKTAGDKLNTVLRQKAEFEKKVAAVEEEVNFLNERLAKAEEEKQNALNQQRDPAIPQDFIVPQRAKRLGAGLGALVMKASKQDWSAALQQFVSTRKGKGEAPEWAKKRDKTAALLKSGK